jgi:2-polyprenyl-3-methyl-5-hydroxy-6-metoxy-1,4-benzoquinol methylase
MPHRAPYSWPAVCADCYQERLWETVPEHREPSYFRKRRDFLMEHVAAGERVLDVGCGEGRFAAELARAGVAVVGVDVAREPLRRAGARYAGLDLRSIPLAGTWPLEDASFDAVWAGEVIEHVADTAGWLSEVRRVLRPGGRLLLSTPDHGQLTRFHLAISRGAFESHFDPFSDHLRFYTRPLLTRLLEEFRFESVRVSAVAGMPGARRLLLARALRARW